MPAAWKLKALREQAKQQAQKTGAKVADGYGRMADEADQSFERMGVKRRTGAYLVGGTTGLVGGNLAARKRADNARKKRETKVGKSLVELSKGFSGRDENSSPATSVKVCMPKGDHQTTTLQTRTGSFAGKTRGKGTSARFKAKSENSSPGVEWVQPRRQDGKFASKEAGLEIFKPRYSTSSRAPRKSTLMRYTKEGDNAARAFTGKSKERLAKAANPGLGRIQTEASLRQIKRLPPVQGVGRQSTERFNAAMQVRKPVSKGAIQTSGATKDFGGQGRRGRRIEDVSKAASPIGAFRNQAGGAYDLMAAGKMTPKQYKEAYGNARNAFGNTGPKIKDTTRMKMPRRVPQKSTGSRPLPPQLAL